MPKTSNRLRTLLLNLLVGAICLALVACDQDVEINQEFSVNIFKPGPKWPNVKKLPPEQRETYEKYGKPDSFHVFWNPEGAIRTRVELEKEMKGKKPKNVPPFSWLYLSSNKEIVFTNGRAVEQPIKDTVRIVALNGDPEDIRSDQPGVTQWMYYSTGRLYKIANGRVIETKEFPAMGKYLKP